MHIDTRFRSPFALVALLGLLVSSAGAPALAKKAKVKKPSKKAGIASHPSEITYPPLDTISLPEPERFTLDNGLRVLLLEDDELPLVQAIAFVRTGSRYETEDQVGVAGFTGAVMRSGGTTSRSSDELNATLENMAASVETSIGTTNGSAVMSALSENFDEVLTLFADVLRNPGFEEDKLEVAKTQAKANVSRQNDTPSQILSRELGELVYGEESPYVRATTYASVDAIDRDDLIAWHQRFFHPENVVLGVTGDFDADTIRGAIEGAFGDWPRGGVSAPPVPDAQVDFEPGVFFIEKSDVNQTNIAIAHLGIKRDNPDYYAVSVLNEVFGGGFTGRLVQQVRSEKGLAYSVGGGVGANWDYPGMFSMQMSTKTESTGAGIEALMTEARRLFEEPPTEDEIAAAKEAMLASMVFTADDAREILQRQLVYEYYGFPSDWLSRYQKGVEAVTSEQVTAAAEKYVQPDRFAILVVGASRDTDPALDTFGEVADIDISIPEPEVSTVAVTSEGAARAKSLIDAAVLAVGGAATLDGLGSIRLDADTKVVTPQGTFDVKTASIVDFPNRQRLEITLPFGTMVQVVTDEDAWMQTPQGVQPMPAAMSDQVKKSLKRTYLNLLRQRGEFVATALGAGEVGGTAVENVQVEVGDDVIRLGIEPSTGHILSMTYRGTDNGGTPGEIVQINSDFQPVEGLTLPHRSELTFEGDPMMTINLSTVTIDPDLSDDLFNRPE